MRLTQWYFVSASQGESRLFDQAPSKSRASTAPATPANDISLLQVPRAMPTATSTAPITITAVLTGISGTSTKPVPKVPTRAPAVPQAESRPTTVPLRCRLCSCRWAMAGDTALSAAAAGTSATTVIPSAASSPSPRAPGPSQCTAGTVSTVSSPPAINSATTSLRVSVRSAR